MPRQSDLHYCRLSAIVEFGQLNAQARANPRLLADALAQVDIQSLQ
ncbi:MAG: hypothetical protein ACLGJA_20660 [Gammaproteobacteria bacterium]